MSKIRKLYEAHQELYANAGSGFTLEDSMFKRGALAYIPAKGRRGKHHLMESCASASGTAATVVVPGPEVEGWDRFCQICNKVALTPLHLATSVSQVLSAVADAGGVCRETGQRFTTLSELFASERFPLPAADHPRDWYNFWDALNRMLSELPSVRSYRTWWSAYGDYVWEHFMKAAVRWVGEREVFTNLMYARARHAMLGPGAFERRGEIGVQALGWRTAQKFVLVAVEDESTEHIKNLKPTDYPTVSEFGAAVEEQLLRLGVEQLYELVDSELEAAWEGENTLLAWTGDNSFTTSREKYFPLLGWFFPAFVIREGVDDTDRVTLGTVADAFATGGLDGFSLIWETAETIRQGHAVDAADLRAAVATLGSPVNA